MTHWWQKPKPLVIPPFKRGVEPKPQPMVVEETPGVDGRDTMIQKIKLFWEHKP